MEKTIYSQEYAQFIQLLRTVREEAGLTQGDIAARLGETQSFVSKCERGERRLDVVELRAWCAALEIPFLKFLRRFEDVCR
jgi:transcriptional regulator with XRE-family HTH domain